MRTYTYDEIMERYKFKIPEDMDTREGTLAHIVMSVTAMSIAQLYEELKILESNCYATTAVGEDLDKSVLMLGMERIKSTPALVKIEGDEGFVVGEAFIGGGLTYRIAEIADGYYVAKCTSLGSIGNSYLGEVLPERNTVLGNAKITGIIASGTDEESDEDLRARYLERIYCPVCMGNVSYYKSALESLPGVGGVKVFPAWEGGGKVKVVITDENYGVANDDLVKYIKEYLDPEETSGLGYGVVPIGHSVTVESAEKVDINIELEVTGTTTQTSYLRTARSFLPGILRELNKTWDKTEKLTIWNRVIEDYFFTLKSVKDVNVISINGVANRFILEENQIIGEVTLNGV